MRQNEEYSKQDGGEEEIARILIDILQIPTYRYMIVVSTSGVLMEGSRVRI